jgi:metal-responsive CopG/Arc/MetJ family transcriptional regulator
MNVTALTVQLDDALAEELRRLAAAQKRSETDIVRDAVADYVQTARPLPTGVGKYRSGQANVSEQARDILRQAPKDGHFDSCDGR